MNLKDIDAAIGIEKALLKILIREDLITENEFNKTVEYFRDKKRKELKEISKESK